jgi:hypothetical protein
LLRKGDFIWIGVLLVFIAILAIPSSREGFINVTEAHPYTGGFIKFAVLATMGDLLGARVSSDYYKKPVGFLQRAVVWGFIGVVTTLALSIFPAGVAFAQGKGMLPLEGSKFFKALFTSMVMNIILSPVIFMFHKFTDTYIDTKYTTEVHKITLMEIVNRIDWFTYVNFSLFKTIPFFWIPCHTIVFLFPAEYRVIASAFASIALGLILALANSSKVTAE